MNASRQAQKERKTLLVLFFLRFFRKLNLWHDTRDLGPVRSFFPKPKRKPATQHFHSTTHDDVCVMFCNGIIIELTSIFKSDQSIIALTSEFNEIKSNCCGFSRTPSSSSSSLCCCLAAVQLSRLNMLHSHWVESQVLSINSAQTSSLSTSHREVKISRIIKINFVFCYSQHFSTPPTSNSVRGCWANTDFWSETGKKLWRRRESGKATEGKTKKSSIIRVKKNSNHWEEKKGVFHYFSIDHDNKFSFKPWELLVDENNGTKVESPESIFSGVVFFLLHSLCAGHSEHTNTSLGPFNNPSGELTCNFYCWLKAIITMMKVEDDDNRSWKKNKRKKTFPSYSRKYELSARMAVGEVHMRLLTHVN